MALNGLKIKVKLFLTLILSNKSYRITFLALQWMICQDINKSELWVFEEISRKLQNSKNSHKNFCPNFWDRHRGSFFLFFHPDNESSEKKTFAEGGYGTTVWSIVRGVMDRLRGWDGPLICFCVFLFFVLVVVEVVRGRCAGLGRWRCNPPHGVPYYDWIP